ASETRVGAQNSRQAVVIGVVGNARQRSLSESTEPQIYFTYPQVTGIFGTLVVRTAVKPESLIDAVKQAVWSVDKEQPVWQIRTLESLVMKDLAPGRFVLQLLSAFSGLALLLSALGTYATLSHSVTQRTRELGIRMALGADRGSVLRMVIVRGIRLAMVGCALGAVASFISARWLGSLLYHVSARDPATFIAGAGVIALAAMLASYFPARRATRVDPMVALRNN